MAQTYRRFSTEFKLGLIEAYLAGRGSIKRLATEAGSNHSLLHYWLRTYERGELSVELQHEEDLRESEWKVAALTVAGASDGPGARRTGEGLGAVTARGRPPRACWSAGRPADLGDRTPRAYRGTISVVK